MNQISEVAAHSATTLIDQGVLGAVLVLSLIVNLLLGWLLWKTRDKYTDHLEAHYDENS